MGGGSAGWRRRRPSPTLGARRHDIEDPDMEDTVGAFVDIVTVAGAPAGPLTGLTFAAKDIYDVAGRPTGCGSPDRRRTHGSAATHAAPVAALLAAGATLAGKSHTDELAYSLMGANAHYGTPVNVAAPDRMPGGSSSGSAAAVAAGLVDIGLGSDTGGSVRLPASFCGLYGLRTTHGRIPLDGTMPLAPSFDVAGWLARDADTLARAGLAFGIETDDTPPGRLLLPVDAWDLAEPAVVEVVAPSVRRLHEAFGPLLPCRISADGLAAWREVFRICQAAEAWEAHGAWITATHPGFGPGVRERFEAASAVSAADAGAARERRAGLAAGLRPAFEDNAVMVVPTGPAPAPRRDAPEAELDAFRARALAMLCPAGIAGLPQLSLPAGKADGAPVGLSLLGAPGSDGRLLAMARRLAG